MRKKLIILIIIIAFPFSFSSLTFTQNALEAVVLEVEGQNRLQRDVPWWQFWNYSLLEKGDHLKEGDRIRTGSKSNIRIEFPGGSLVRIGPNSLFKIDKIGKEKNGLHLSRGSLGAKIINIIEGIITFEVETPSAVAAVRGTEFTLKVKRRETVLSVKEGNVLLIAEGIEKLVSTDQTSSVTRDNPPLDPQKIPEDKRAWLEEFLSDIIDLPKPPIPSPPGN